MQLLVHSAVNIYSFRIRLSNPSGSVNERKEVRVCFPNFLQLSFMDFSLELCQVCENCDRFLI